MIVQSMEKNIFIFKNYYPNGCNFYLYFYCIFFFKKKNNNNNSYNNKLFNYKFIIY